MTDNIIHTYSRPYESTVHIALPSAQHAQQLKDVVSVDEEISNKVVKSFSIVTSKEAAAYEDHIDDGADIDKDEEDGNRRVLRINFVATDAKMLRVSMSTTYDMINVALKCFQEFEGS